MTIDFAPKLAVVLKALAISRGRLAAELGVDKSVVSRWLGGLYTPSGENLSRLTRFVAARVPGFTGLDWDRELVALSSLFGAVPAETLPTHGPTIPGLAAARDNTAAYGAGYVGHWCGWRTTFNRRDGIAGDALRIRRIGDDLAVDAVNGATTGKGWMLLANGKATMIMDAPHSDLPVLCTLYTLNGRDGKVAQYLDGVMLLEIASASRAICAAPYVLQRVSDLVPDADVDDRFFAARCAALRSIDRSAAPPEILRRLEPAREINDWVLRLSGDDSLTRLATPIERAASAAAAAHAAGNYRN